jgi:hypothetical protein
MRTRASGRHEVNPMMPLITSRAPRALNPIRRPDVLQADPGFGALDGLGRPVRRDNEAEKRDLEQPEHHDVESDHEQTVSAVE